MSLAEHRVEVALSAHRQGGALLPLVIAFEVWARETWSEEWLNGRLLRRAGPSGLLEELVDVWQGDANGNDVGTATRLWHGALRELAMRAPDKVPDAVRRSLSEAFDPISGQTWPIAAGRTDLLRAALVEDLGVDQLCGLAVSALRSIPESATDFRWQRDLRRELAQLVNEGVYERLSEWASRPIRGPMAMASTAAVVSRDLTDHLGDDAQVGGSRSWVLLRARLHQVEQIRSSGLGR